MIHALTESLIKPKGFSDEDLTKIGWYVFAEGETKHYPFALLRAIRNTNGNSPLSKEELTNAKANYDYNVMAHVPYYFQLMIMPLNFPEFWPLIFSIDKFKAA
jgi:hypothetical protein